MNSTVSLELILGTAAAFYCIVHLALLVGLNRVRYKRVDAKPFVSVIVAARNEEQNIARLLRQLLNQDYTSYEVIVINDRSTDRTGEIIDEFCKMSSALKQVRVDALNDDMPAKKYALAQGIAESNGEILCFTDADCFPSTHWISEMVSLFDKDVGLVAGYSPYVSPALTQRERSWPLRILHSFIAYEELKGATWSAASIGLGKAWLCTGRSLAYRRQVFDEVNGFERIKESISGDDDLFLQQVRSSTSWGIRYVTSPESYVTTTPPPNVRQFVRQRIRHFSAGKFFPLSLKTFFFLFHLCNLLLFLTLLEVFGFGISAWGVWPFGIKLLADLTLFRKAVRMFHHHNHRLSFIAFEILYVLYNSLIGPLGFVTRVQWKSGGTGS